MVSDFILLLRYVTDIPTPAPALLPTLPLLAGIPLALVREADIKNKRGQTEGGKRERERDTCPERAG